MQCDFQCNYCGEWNSIHVDESAGLLQDYVEDCQVCCQPNVLSIRFDQRHEQFVIWAERES
ncbi:MAG: CPXCG motif-containing cysteine-rich protein [Candidatus Korobacteraceae bacterium]